MPKIWSVGKSGSVYRIVGNIDSPEYVGPFTAGIIEGNCSGLDILDGVEPKDPPATTPEALEALATFNSRYRAGGRAILLAGNYPKNVTIRSIT